MVDPNYHPGVSGLASIDAIVPSVGAFTGGTQVEIQGHLFQSGVKATIGGNDCTPVTFISSTKFRCFTAAHAIGVGDLVVTNPDGLTTISLHAFTFTDTVTPSSGTAITIGGGKFSSGTGGAVHAALGEAAGAAVSTNVNGMAISGVKAIVYSP